MRCYYIPHKGGGWAAARTPAKSTLGQALRRRPEGAASKEKAMKRKISPDIIVVSQRTRVALLQEKALKRQFPEGRLYLSEDGYRFSAPRYHTYHGGPHWVVVKTAFHGGGIISRHYTEKAAQDAADRYQIGDCICGCAGVLRRDHLDGLESLDRNTSYTHNPYALVT